METEVTSAIFFSTSEGQEFTVWGVMINFDSAKMRKIMEQLYQ